MTCGCCKKCTKNDANPLTCIKEQYKFTEVIKRFIATGLRNVREDTQMPPGVVSMGFVNLHTRAVPEINVDNTIMSEYNLDYAWRENRA